ncbi:hypothetical protein GJ904_20150 [Salmonella enterica]|nr:hypothetical protein [Salmonella enterica subsp. enterica serovar Saintpaul]EEC1303378.1 hypothetical protein [Salmonella enterica]
MSVHQLQITPELGGRILVWLRKEDLILEESYTDNGFRSRDKSRDWHHKCSAFTLTFTQQDGFCETYVLDKSYWKDGLPEGAKESPSLDTLLGWIIQKYPKDLRNVYP